MSAPRRVYPWVWTLLIAAVAVVLVGTIGIGTSPVEILTQVAAVLAVVLIAAFGSIIGSRQPGNRIAWLFHAISIGVLISVPAAATVGNIDPSSPGFPGFWDYAAVVIVDGLSGSILFAVFLLLYVFPTGRFLTRRWVWAGWVPGVFVPIYLVATLFTESFVEHYTETPAWMMSNPIGFLPTEAYDSMTTAWILLVLASAAGGVVAMFVRYRRSDVVVRTQIKWVLYAAAVAAISLPLGWGDSPYSELFMSIAFFLIPIAITIAVMRYKLFEIDRIISRTLSYALLVGLLGLAYTSGAVWIPTALGLGDSPLLVAASTLAVAALFNPLRRRIQRAVDRRFNRSRYQAQEVTDEFTSRLQTSLTRNQLADMWVETVQTHFEPSMSGVWIKED